MIVSATQLYENSSCFYDYLTDLFQKKKNELVSILKNTKIKWRVLEPEGGFFVLVDISDCINDIPKKYFYDGEIPESEKDIDDYKNLKKLLFLQILHLRST